MNKIVINFDGAQKSGIGNPIPLKILIISNYLLVVIVLAAERALVLSPLLTANL